MKKKIGMVLLAVIVLATLVAFVLPTDAQAATQPAVATDEVAAYLATQPVIPDGSVATISAVTQAGQNDHGVAITALSLPWDVPIVPAAAILICLIAVAAVTFRYYARIMAFTTTRQPGVARRHAPISRTELWRGVCLVGMTLTSHLCRHPWSGTVANLFVDGDTGQKRTRGEHGVRCHTSIRTASSPAG